MTRTSVQRPVSPEAPHHERQASLDDIVCLRNGGLLREAVAAARLLAGTTPTEPHLRALGLLEMEMGSTVHAMRALQEAVIADPTSAAAHNHLGVCALELNDVELAVVSFEQAALDEQIAPQALANLGRAYLRAGKPYDAERVLMDSLRDHDSARTRIALAEAWVQLEMRDQATQLLRQVIGSGEADYEALSLMMRESLGLAQERHVAATEAWLGRKEHAGLRALRARAADGAAPDAGAALRKSFRRLVRVWDLPPTHIDVVRDFTRQVAEHPTMCPVSPEKDSREGLRSGDLFAEPNIDLDELHDIISAAVTDFTQDLLITHPEHLLARTRPDNVRLRARAQRLERGESQSVHFHPDSWLSGVLYLRVPQGIEEGHPGGHLMMGANLNDTESVCPQVGRIVLFPSCVEHRTLPFDGPGTRLSIGFDVVPVS